MSTLAGSFAPGYSPTQVPVSVDALPGWLSDETARISSAITSITGFIPLVNAAPDKPRDGLVRATNATAWNPGGGAGIYAYYSGAWNRLIEIAGSTTIAAGAVGTTQLADSAVTTAKLVDLAVNSAKLADLAVSLAKLGTGAVDTSKLVDGAVSAIKIADGSVTIAKHATGLKPVIIASSLPALPNSTYPQGTIVTLTTNNKLYRSTGSSWTTSVATTDLSGTIDLATQISGTLSTSFAAAGLINSNITINPDGTLVGAAAGYTPTLALELIGNAPSLSPVVGDATFTVTRAGTATRVNASGLIETVAADTARFDYDPVTLACKGLLVEEARTNDITYSDLSASGTYGYVNLSPATVTDDGMVAGTAPDGSNLVRQFTCTGSGTIRLRGNYLDGVAGTSYAGSVYVRTADGSSKTVGIDVNDGGYTNFTVNGEWQRLHTAWAHPTQPYRFVDLDPTEACVIQVWGSQLETGAFPTSYIPTTSAAVTRNADVVTCADISGFFNSSEGTVFAEFDGRRNGQVVAINDGTENNRYSIAVTNTGAAISYAVVSGGAVQSNLFPSYTEGATSKFAAAYKANDFAISLDGAAVLTDTAGTLPTVSNIMLGHNTASAYINGHLRRFAYFNTRLANADLVALSGSGLAFSRASLTTLPGKIYVGQLAANSVVTENLAALAVTAAKIAANTITAAQIAAGTITTAEIAANTILAGNIAAGAISTSELAANAVTASKLAITGAHMDGLAWTSNSPSAGYVAWTAFTLTVDGTTYSISSGNSNAEIIWFDRSVSTTTLQGSTRAAFEAAFNALDKDVQLAYNSSGTAQPVAQATAISGGAIRTGAIITEKIAAGAITTTELAASAVTAAKITSGTITATQIAAGTITATQIAAGTITANEIAASTITAGKMSVSTLSSIAADLGSITAGSINIGSGKFTVSSAGIVSIVSATTGARLTIANSVIKVYDSLGTLRVQIGDLLA